MTKSISMTSTITVIIATILAFTLIAFADTAFAAKPSSCATIQSGTITDSSGNPLTVGYDQFGYNYQAHMFNGTYDSSDRNIDGTYWGSTGDYVDDSLIMKWSDAWLANVDCNGDGKLDRGLVDGVVGGTSKGWLTNEVNGDYDSDGDGIQDAHYTWFVKIVWVGPGGSLWGEYEIIQEVYNDPVGGFHGLQFKVGAPGFGLNDRWTQ
ncbi:MAG: hypothetical protein A2W52_01255 [Candidatus Taylorbacteria bacterium RIFCSPHIGHO2_02_49_25]|uniref:EF-hand domain-containing protein n=1 Tax=Candidatus Taylorbacteria bacterium RIFCSPHIGHO2_02_49_25 TaxID=1802305 RepID=A0A1G2MDM9_9BACT|nr:MAG: hypothetical protein UY62_C0073G0008 [Parcubacteria group bacterium GW2011_GWF2_50_9]OHA19969.1 MAG: hypothetical protein A2759_03435 [Candidatus Taylorbacteria bacterium RIFCSPHIGHO2_01_FULL_49_60]OHA22005.1 MAG: hypothetical protein A2W52_01255 [Candidatus Taylorbacteria bacterium RIFCSPHIGHO2_02_49_25]OHA48308.1 MAG: hypothetical protein A3G61_00690 [Candidatus Taylorbacteria bacterium RIFCSPLOWO2_12_FULL_49_67]